MKPKIGDSVRILEQEGAQVNIGDIGKIVGTTTYREQGGNEPYSVYLTVMEKPLAGFENFEWEFTEEAVELVETKKSPKPVKYFLYYIDDSISKIKSFDSKKELVSFCKEFAKTPDFEKGYSWLEYVFKGYGAKVKVKPSIKFEGLE